MGLEKILVTGGSGLLGSMVARKGEELYDAVATFNKHKIKASYKSLPLDITGESAVHKIIKKERPNAVIHTAAMTNVDMCETQRKVAWRTNVEGTRHVAEACNACNAKMIYVSTDFVFDGERGRYKEEGATNPINYYGLTKLKGEEVLKEACSDWSISRVSVLYGWNVVERMNFVTWVIDKLGKGERINIVTDQFTSPTFAGSAAGLLLKMYKLDSQGIFHISGRERINRYDFARKIAEVFSLDESLISPVKSEYLKQEARRPKDSSLDVSKAKKILRAKLLNVEEGLTKMREGR